MIKVFKNLRASELNYMARADYISSVQTDINFAMRAILCDWLIEVADEYSLLPATFALCINYVDRFLSVRVVRREKLQLVGIACMLIAAKYEEIFPPTVDDFVYISDNTYCKAEVLEMESQILKALSFSMTVVTPMAYLDHYSSHVADVTEPELFSLAHYVCELNMIEPVYFRYAPSMFAAVCVSVAYHSLHGGVEMFPDDVLLFSGYEAQDMLECFTAVHRVYSANQSKVIKAVFDKFAKTKYHSVSLIPVRAMSPVELS
jgi:cyclin A